MNKIISTILFSILFGLFAQAQQKTQNVVIVTLDGLRWQEVFGGLDQTLVNNTIYTREPEKIKASFGGETQIESRRKLFPFLWNVMAQNGQLRGNRNEGSKMNVANRYQFSYPGYNEIFTGFPDETVNSNDNINNKNTSVLEFLNHKSDFKGKIAVFSSWEAFPYILNELRSGVYVNSDKDTLNFKNPNLKLVNDLQLLAPRPVGVRPDILTYMAGREYLKTYHPRVLCIALDETDDLPHAGMYDQYLMAAHAEDAMLADIWNILQSDQFYKDKTTLLVTCDHGRGGLGKDTWKDHGENIQESGETWIAIMGPNVKQLGEVKTNEQLFQKQCAATIAQLLGLTFTAEHPVAEPFQEIIEK